MSVLAMALSFSLVSSQVFSLVFKSRLISADNYCLLRESPLFFQNCCAAQHQCSLDAQSNFLD